GSQEMSPMKPRMATAFELGVTAALVLTLVMVLVRVGEVSRLDLEMMTGALFTRSVGPVTWAIGSGVHLLAGGLFGMLYGRIFEAWGGAGWRRGMLVAVAHTLVSG